MQKAGGRSDGIDIMQRIFVLHNFANTLTNGKVIVKIFTLCDVAHRCYVIYTVHFLYNQYIIQHTHSVLHHLLYRPLSTPTRFGPGAPSSGSRYNIGI